MRPVCYDVCIALILIVESPKQVINLVIHLGNPGINSRSKGNGCPYCSPQTSRPEIALYTELKTIFKNTKWREKINEIECDIYLENYKLAFEYDGWLYHKNKEKQDLKKNKELAKHGITIIRIREHGLKLLSDKDINLNKKMSEINLVKSVLSKVIEENLANKNDM